jgi:hypothetical protein
MTPEHLQESIIRARCSGFASFATALEQEYLRQFPRVHSFKWHMVTGRDFGRANRWAKTQKNLGEQIKESLSK